MLYGIMGVAPPLARDRILLIWLWVVTFLSKGALFYENHLGINSAISRSTYFNETWNITLPICGNLPPQKKNKNKKKHNNNNNKKINK